jgi:hypothetical protein
MPLAEYVCAERHDALHDLLRNFLYREGTFIEQRRIEMRATLPIFVAFVDENFAGRASPLINFKISPSSR